MAHSSLPQQNVSFGKLSEVQNKLTFSSIVNSITIVVINMIVYRFVLANSIWWFEVKNDWYISCATKLTLSIATLSKSLKILSQDLVREIHWMSYLVEFTLRIFIHCGPVLWIWEFQNLFTIILSSKQNSKRKCHIYMVKGKYVKLSNLFAKLYTLT
jgi:hypothetical protein